ncbi:unnamed protein product [Dovyalis caffra]|uniref:TIR domain-containing protein n=1 Tax=Dovyalis caffra TaxID=77055 RepID=A0AAV1RE98_9ROSI|nr:unnamed protein product [Dovyalis caffra]
MASASTPQWKYDVFLSFRGKDTRDGFTSHLYDALLRNQIVTFIDYELGGGESIEPGLLEKIEQSNISVVIFSKNYADSPFCLAELSKILEWKETKGQIVIPIFYQVDPTDVQELRGSFGDALRIHEQNCSSDLISAEQRESRLEEVRSWRRALTEIAKLKGWDSNVTK